MDELEIAMAAINYFSIWFPVLELAFSSSASLWSSFSPRQPGSSVHRREGDGSSDVATSSSLLPCRARRGFRRRPALLVVELGASKEKEARSTTRTPLQYDLYLIWLFFCSSSPTVELGHGGRRHQVLAVVVDGAICACFSLDLFLSICLFRFASFFRRLHVRRGAAAPTSSGWRRNRGGAKRWGAAAM